MNVSDTSWQKELLGLALALALVGVSSVFAGGFWWMAGIILASEVLWLAVTASAT